MKRGDYQITVTPARSAMSSTNEWRETSKRWLKGYVCENFGVAKQDGEWVITHLATGRRLAAAYPRLRDAKRAIKALEECGVDWSKSTFTSFTSRDKRAASKALRSIPEAET